MGSKVNYTLVGIFVIALTAALVALIVWLTSGLNGTEYKTYVVHMNESVSGLSPKSQVKFNGVDVGYVRAIKLNPEDPKQVILYLSIDKEVIVHQDTIATLQSQGLTGLAYVGLRGGSADSGVLKAAPGYEYPQIRAEPSLLMRLDIIAQRLTQNLDGISSAIGRLLSEKNTVAFSNMVRNLDHISKVWVNNSANMDKTIKNFSNMSVNLDKASQRLPALTSQFSISLNKFDGMVANISQTSSSLRQTLRSGNHTLQSLSTQLLPQSYMLLDRLSHTSANLQSLSNELRVNPSILLRGKQLPSPGPGEKH